MFRIGILSLAMIWSIGASAAIYDSSTFFCADYPRDARCLMYTKSYNLLRQHEEEILQMKTCHDGFQIRRALDREFTGQYLPENERKVKHEIYQLLQGKLETCVD